MSHVLANAAIYSGKRFPNAKGHTECVEFIRQTMNAPNTAVWREGTKIVRIAPGQTDPIPSGTAIATFVGGRYPHHGSTGKHAAIYLGQDATGIHVMDQWNSQNQVRRRTIYWHPHSGGLGNNANAFSVIEW